jgi:hypothetical protein
MKTVSGIIFNDTTWRAGKNIVIDGEVQIAPGASLVVEPGAKISGGTLRVFGEFMAMGSIDEKIEFSDVEFLFGSEFRTPGRIDIAHAEILGGSFLRASGYASYGSFSVTDSHFLSKRGFYIWYPTESSDFIRNIFENIQGISAGLNSGVYFYLENNLFINNYRALN